MSSKRKTRAGSSTDGDKSPLEKRKRDRSNNKSESSISDEPDVFQESTMDDLSKKVDLILSKLQKLDNIECRLNDLISTVSSIEETTARLDHDVEALKNKFKPTNKTVKELEESVEFNDEDISDLKKDVKAVSWDVSSQRKNLLYQEHYNRRENLIFSGVTEQMSPSDDNSEAAENPQENTKDIIYSFLEDNLKIENPRRKNGISESSPTRQNSFK